MNLSKMSREIKSQISEALQIPSRMNMKKSHTQEHWNKTAKTKSKDFKTQTQWLLAEEKWGRYINLQ